MLRSKNIYIIWRQETKRKNSRPISEGLCYQEMSTIIWQWCLWCRVKPKFGETLTEKPRLFHVVVLDISKPHSFQPRWPLLNFSLYFQFVYVWTFSKLTPLSWNWRWSSLPFLLKIIHFIFLVLISKSLSLQYVSRRLSISCNPVSSFENKIRSSAQNREFQPPLVLSQGM